MGTVEWLVISLVLLAIIVAVTLGRGREPHVGRLPGHYRRSGPLPPGDDGGHFGSFTRPPDLRHGPGEEEE